MSGEGAGRRDHRFALMAYGDSPYLEGCLTSLLAQAAPGGIVIATSTPSAHIERIAVSAAVPIKVNPAREGIAADWNFALASAEARYVTLAHQDDVYYPRFLARSLDLLARGAAVAFTGYQEIDDAGAPSRSRISVAKHVLERLALGTSERPSAATMRRFLAFGNPLPCSSVSFDREQVGDFAFDARYRSNLDWDAWLRLIDGGAAFARTPERLVGRRHNPLTATASLTRQGVRAAEDAAMFARLWPSPLAELIGLAYKAGYK